MALLRSSRATAGPAFVKSCSAGGAHLRVALWLAAPAEALAKAGRAGGIRTHGLLVPNQARYQLRHSPLRPFSRAGTL